MNDKSGTTRMYQYARRALANEYGFAPEVDEITLLECYMDNNDPQYVRFQVGGFEYSFDGITLEKKTKTSPLRSYMIVSATTEGPGASFADTYTAARGIKLDIECGLGGYAEIYERKEDDGLSWYELLEA